MFKRKLPSPAAGFSFWKICGIMAWDLQFRLRNLRPVEVLQAPKDGFNPRSGRSSGFGVKPRAGVAGSKIK